MNRIERNNALNKIKDLYRAYRLIDGLKNQVSEYNRLLEYKIREQLELKNLHIDAEEGFNTSYEEKFSCSKDTTSNIEKQIINYIEKLKADELSCRQSINEIHDKIKNINVRYGMLKDNIDCLGEFEKEIIELICRDKKSIVYVGNTLFCGVTKTAYLTIDKILTEVMTFENWRVESE